MEKEMQADVGEADGAIGSHAALAEVTGDAEAADRDTAIPPEEEVNLKREDEDVGEDAVVPLEGRSVSKGGRRAAVLKRGLAALSLFVVGIGMLMSLKPIRMMLIDVIAGFLPDDFGSKELKVPEMSPVSMRDLIKCEGQFKSSVSDFKSSWEKASPRVKEAFIKYFVPSGKDNQDLPVDPLALYTKHINAMLETPRPDGKDARGLQEHKFNLLLLNAICSTAAGNIKRLGAMEELHARTGVPVPVLGLGKRIDLPAICSTAAGNIKRLGLMEELHARTGVPVPVLGLGKRIDLPPLTELLDQEDDGKTVAEFLKDFGVTVKLKGETSKVPKQVADSLRDLMHESELVAGCMSEAPIQFHSFFKFHNLLQKNIPANYYPKVNIRSSGEVFDVGLFVLDSMLDARSRDEVQKVRSFLSNTIARQWCTRRAADFVSEQQAYVTYTFERELERKKRFLSKRSSEGGSVDPESLQAIARFVV
ncbi:hypothetical protein, conserved [Eimeria praecox]|uniref:Uncharacterized protein n=1 Tax=Eimeria praecox TaxID=51316 RepID=U6G1Z5_9EIME|nr:hypothetical protein, conserved [Eimeria praecox]